MHRFLPRQRKRINERLKTAVGNRRWYSVSKDKSLIEDFFRKAALKSKPNSISLSQVQESYMRKVGCKIQPKNYGFTQLYKLANSFDSIDTFKDETTSCIRVRVDTGTSVQKAESSLLHDSRSRDKMIKSLNSTSDEHKKMTFVNTLQQLPDRWGGNINSNKHKPNISGLQQIESNITKLLHDKHDGIDLQKLLISYFSEYQEHIGFEDYGNNSLVELLQSFCSLKVNTTEDGTSIKLHSDFTSDNGNPSISDVIFVDTPEAIATAKTDGIFSDPATQAKEVTAIDVEIVDEKLSLVQVSSSKSTYVFDAQVLGQHVVYDTIASLLRNRQAIKLMHDLHTEAEMFTGEGNITLRGVLDSQLVVEHATGILHAGYNAMLAYFGMREHPLKSFMKHTGHDGNLISLRPLPLKALNYAALDTALLLNANKAIHKQCGLLRPLLIKASEDRAKFGADHSQWRSVCFDASTDRRLSSSELLHSVRPNDILQSEQVKVHSDISSLLEILPDDLQEAVQETSVDSITELVLDIGETMYAWENKKRLTLGSRVVTIEDIEHVLILSGDIGTDNRTGIDKQLHRISVIRNRDDTTVGMTMRVGRHVVGCAFLISDILESDSSILFIGAPGSRKTTIIREISRVLSETKNVIIVDSSNEIAGAGNIKHASVGKARRMFVRKLEDQSDVMIECVQNHRPDVMVIDEIGHRREADAARTASRRGVRLIATAHGSFQSLLGNPDTNGLLGGITNVTVGDKTADQGSGFRKTREERASSPVFDVVVELGCEEDYCMEWTVILNTAEAVDSILQKRQYISQRRKWNGKSSTVLLQLLKL